jgi:hypothetical protein
LVVGGGLIDKFSFWGVGALLRPPRGSQETEVGFPRCGSRFSLCSSRNSRPRIENPPTSPGCEAGGFLLFHGANAVRRHRTRFRWEAFGAVAHGSLDGLWRGKSLTQPRPLKKIVRRKH